jgi:hypothetical protein
MKGIGNEFERIEEIKKLMLNLLFNKFSCSMMMYLTPIRPTKWAHLFTLWNQAPTNLKVLTDNGIVLR